MRGEVGEVVRKGYDFKWEGGAFIGAAVFDEVIGG